MSERAKTARRKTQSERRKELVEELWGKELDKLLIWDRKKNDGFATVPRTLPYIGRILDELSGTGFPLSHVYAALWCRVFDEGFIEVQDKETFAYEAGFSGQRAVTTWLGRIKKLEELGFISCKSGAKGDYQYLLLLHPLKVIKSLYKEGKAQDQRYTALAARMSEIGATWDEKAEQPQKLIILNPFSMDKKDGA